MKKNFSLLFMLLISTPSIAMTTRNNQKKRHQEMIIELSNKNKALSNKNRKLTNEIRELAKTNGKMDNIINDRNTNSAISGSICAVVTAICFGIMNHQHDKTA
jgi:hypothetical protein